MNDHSIILVMEDENPLVRVIRSKLEGASFEVVTARSVEQGLHYLEEGVEINAIWLDHYLIGQKNGLDFVAELRKNEEFKDVPIFVVTNTGTHDKEHTYLKLGAEKYYVKSNHRLDGIVTDIKAFLQKNK